MNRTHAFRSYLDAAEAEEAGAADANNDVDDGEEEVGDDDDIGGQEDADVESEPRPESKPAEKPKAAPVPARPQPKPAAAPAPSPAPVSMCYTTDPVFAEANKKNPRFKIMLIEPTALAKKIIAERDAEDLKKWGPKPPPEKKPADTAKDAKPEKGKPAEVAKDKKPDNKKPTESGDSAVGGPPVKRGDATDPQTIAARKAYEEKLKAKGMTPRKPMTEEELSKAIERGKKLMEMAKNPPKVPPPRPPGRWPGDNIAAILDRAKKAHPDPGKEA